MKRLLLAVFALTTFSAGSLAHSPAAPQGSSAELRSTRAAIRTAVSASATPVLRDPPTATRSPQARATRLRSSTSRATATRALTTRRTPTPTPTRAPDVEVAHGYLLTLADLPPGYRATYSDDDDWVADFEAALEAETDPLQAVTASAYFELKDSAVEGILAQPWIVEESLYWYNSPRLAATTLSLLEIYLDEEYLVGDETATVERVDLGAPGESNAAYRLVDRTDPRSPVVVYVALSQRGSFLVLLVTAGASSGMTQEAAADLLHTAVAKLGP